MLAPMGNRGPKPKPAAERFWRLVDRRGPDECWPWLGHRHRGGHGQFNVGDDQRVYAHRFSFELHHGRPVTDGLFVLHKAKTCHTPACCNPAHLYEGTDVENTRDKYLDDTVPVGDRHWRSAGVKGKPDPIRPATHRGHVAKLSEADIPVIRALVQWSGFTHQEVADEYGVSRKNIGYIVARKTWAEAPCWV